MPLNTSETILQAQRDYAAANAKTFVPAKIVVERIDTNSGEVIAVESDGLLSLSRSLDMAGEFNRLCRSVGYSPDTRVYVVDTETGERVEVTR